MKVTSSLTSTLLGGLVFFAAQSAYAAKIPLVTFFSAARGDHFTTSNPLVTCAYFGGCAAPAGYVAVGMQGHVWSPTDPKPTGTNTLYHWWDPSRGDNFLTSDPAWAGSVGATKDGYTLFRIEGYVSQVSTGFGLALKSYWNPATADNAALATWRWTTGAGYTNYRLEGFLLPPDGASCALTPNYVDPVSWQARGNYVDTWAQQDFLHGDRIQFTAPANTYTIDYWGNTRPVRGNASEIAGPGYPAPGRPAYALLARVTTGRVFTNTGWFEANQWFQALGSQQAWDGPCVLYNAAGVTAGEVETMFNDTNVGDNSGAANVKVRQWW